MMQRIARWMCGVLLCGLPSHAVAATYYVSKAGNDSRFCAVAQSIAAPKLTVNSGLGCLRAGDTLFVRAGTYAENITSVASGTSWTNKVRIAAYPGETVWLTPTSRSGGTSIVWLDCNCAYIEFDGINLDGRPSSQNGLWVSTNNGNHPHHVRLKNSEVIGAGNGGGAILLGAHTFPGQIGGNEVQHVTVHGGGIPGQCGFACASYAVYLPSPNNLVEDCDFYDTSGAFVQIYSKLGEGNGNVIRRNKMHDLSRTGDINQVWGVVVVGANNQIYDNLIYNITIVGGQTVGNAAIAVTNTGNKIWNNTIYNVANAGITVSLDAGGHPAINNEVRNNIVYMIGTDAFNAYDSPSTIQDHNLFGVNPLFVNAAAGDFHLQSTSPAVDAGTTITTVATDIAGDRRPSGRGYDIGAYERQALSAPRR